MRNLLEIGTFERVSWIVGQGSLVYLSQEMHEIRKSTQFLANNKVTHSNFGQILYL